MKRKAKIITTIASLCLAVALLAFGVYAATSATLTVASKVSFSVVDVFVDVTGNAYTGAAGTQTTPLGATYSQSSYSGTAATEPGSSTPLALTGWTVDDYAFTVSAPAIKYVITIHNASTTDAVYINIPAGFMPELAGTTRSGTTQNGDAAAANITFVSSNTEQAIATNVSLAAGKDYEVTLVRVLTDFTASFSAAANNSIDSAKTITISKTALS